ncbi:MAG: PilZ domain-containing protein [Planctomycetes bacterium]|nr:PilZ domain-containing protein [Planctomycetota bacterium]
MDMDKRRHKRIPLKLSIFCQRVGHSGGKLFAGRTLNVSPSGMLVEMKNDGLRDGELLSIEMTVPPTEGMLEFGGSFSSYARVVRKESDNEGDVSTESSYSKTVALEFCDSPKLRL